VLADTEPALGVVVRLRRCCSLETATVTVALAHWHAAGPRPGAAGRSESLVTVPGVRGGTLSATPAATVAEPESAAANDSDWDLSADGRSLSTRGDKNSSGTGAGHAGRCATMGIHVEIHLGFHSNRRVLNEILLNQLIQ
jgi:hypothetical protein